MKQKTKAQFSTTPRVKASEVSHQWFILDAAGKTLGRLSAEVAKILRGKHKPLYCPDRDIGDGVILLNADKVRVTGNKEAQKVYRHHTGWIGNFKEIPYRVMQQKKPQYIIEHAVKGMMPKTRLGRAQMKRLRIFAGEEHNMQSQKPVKVNI